MNASRHIDRGAAVLGGLWAALALLGACDKGAPEAPQEAPPATSSGAPSPEDTDRAGEPGAETTTAEDAGVELPEGVVARGRGFELRVEDVRRAMERGILMAPDEALRRGVRRVPPGRFKVPFVQMSTTRSLVLGELLAREAERLGVEVTLEQVEAHAAADPRLSRFGPTQTTLADGTTLPITLEDLGMSRADVHAIARDQLLRERVRQALLEEISDEEVWQAYQRQRDRARVLLARVDNTPDLRGARRLHGLA